MGNETFCGDGLMGDIVNFCGFFFCRELFFAGTFLQIVKKNSQKSQKFSTTRHSSSPRLFRAAFSGPAFSVHQHMSAHIVFNNNRIRSECGMITHLVFLIF